jgi:protoheme IX farnesyltransferase
MGFVRRIAASAIAATFLMIVLAGMVRIAGGSLACADWPLCQGSLGPPLTLPALIEFAYRWVVLVAVGLGGLTALAVWRTGGEDRLLRRLALALGVTLLGQIGLGMVSGTRAETGVGMVAQLGVSQLLFATLVMIATASQVPAAVQKPLGARAQRAGRRFRWLVRLTTIALFGLLLSGATVVAMGARGGCGTSFPGCLGGWLPFGVGPQTDMQLTHRLVGAAVGLLLLWTIWQTYRQRRQQTLLVKAALATGLLLLFQVLAGASYLWAGLPNTLAGLHLALATLVWGGQVVFAVLAERLPQPEVAAAPARQPKSAAVEGQAVPSTARSRFGDYVTLTKPRIISLLLVTTAMPMIIAQGGMPPLGLVFWTMVGGYLAAGGANAINMFYDRDIDIKMGRTSKRPLPSQRLAPTHALRFGLVLTLLSFAVFAVFVNVLAGLLALAGVFYYIVIYTHWLKRSSPQNIVIGGGAGAIPPLVGYAAVTNDLSLLAIWLFIIIFYWTPPHFWALALMRRVDYERAGVPMLPVVYGEAETRKQILLYSMLLVVLSLLLTPLGMMGVIYFVSAAILGSIWLYYALKIVRSENPEAAWGLYKYSLLYLALLFVAMAADRVVA